MNAFLRRLLEVAPAQKTQHETELGETVFGAVAPGFTNNLIQNTGQIRGVLETEILSERHGRSGDDGVGQLGVPDEELFEADMAGLERQGHGRLGEIKCLQSRLEIDQPVTPRDLKEAIAKVRLNKSPFA